MESKGLFEKLQEYAETDNYPYHMPGHKRRQLGKLPTELLGIDITEIDGFDNLHQAEGILHTLQERANALYQAEETFYLINGSTGGILSAVSAALPEGGHLLMARGCHKSVYHAVYLRRLRVTYLYSELVPGFDFSEAVTAGEVESALQGKPDIGAVLIVSPTYEGRIADVRAIADVVHRRGIPLIVDEAHGAHLGFAEGFAEGSCTCGADLVIHSVHKTLPALTQTALLHVNGDLIDRERLKRFLHIYQSSSPSYLLMAGIDDAIDIVERRGRELFAKFRFLYGSMLEHLQVCKRLRFVPKRDVEQGRQDIGKLIIATDRAGVSGQWLYDALRERFHLQCEMAAGNYCLAMFTLADDETAYERVEQALLSLDEELEGSAEPQSVGMGGASRQFATSTKETRVGETRAEEAATGETDAVGATEWLRPMIACPLTEAWDAPWELSGLSAAIGRPAADFVNLYPPGIPILVPGEILTEEICRRLLEYHRQRLNLQGIVVKEEGLYIKILQEKAEK